jgi:hypothetical protein
MAERKVTGLAFLSPSVHRPVMKVGENTLFPFNNTMKKVMNIVRAANGDVEVVYDDGVVETIVDAPVAIFYESPLPPVEDVTPKTGFEAAKEHLGGPTPPPEPAPAPKPQPQKGQKPHAQGV